jgi:hypothetical protein
MNIVKKMNRFLQKTNKISTLLFLAQQMPYTWHNDKKIDQE